MVEGQLPIVQLLDEVYRAKETAKLSLRLSFTMAELLNAIDRYCEENNIKLSEGVLGMLDEAERFLQKIRETQTLPLSELLKRPPTQLLPNDRKQRNEPNEDGNSSSLPKINMHPPSKL